MENPKILEIIQPNKYVFKPDYPKIQSIFKRRKNKYFIEDAFSCPEFKFLQDLPWEFTEKIHGMNLRITWNAKLTRGFQSALYSEKVVRNQELTFRGRKTINQVTDQLSPKMIAKLRDLFPDVTKFVTHFPDTEEIRVRTVTFYGEGYGGEIKKGGKYRLDESFILFDVLIENYNTKKGRMERWWLNRSSIEDIATKFVIDVVPLIGTGTLQDAINLIKQGVQSTFGNFLAEGLVLKPKVQMLFRDGNPIITKIKHRDFPPSS